MKSQRSRSGHHRRSERGQSFLIIAILVTMVLLGVLGVAADYTQIWAHRQMAQGAADAACQAAAANLYVAGVAPSALPPSGTSWVGTAFNCGSQPSTSPCRYAALNGYTGSNITVSFPATVPGVTALPASFGITYPFVQVNITDPVAMSFTKLFLANPNYNVTAKAVCGLQSLDMPIPLVVLNQTQSQTLSTSGSPTVQIIGGPNRSVQVNSTSTSAVNVAGSSTIDLRLAGPNNNGADFGLSGSESKPGGVQLGSAGTWLSPDLPYNDPWANIATPAVPTTLGTAYPVPLGVNGCPDPNGCVEFTGGSYVGCSTGTIAPYGQGCINLPYTGSNPKFSIAGLNFQPSHVYKVGDMIQPTSGGGSGCGTVNTGGFLYMVTTAGTSGTCPAAASWIATVCTKQADGTCTPGSSSTTSGTVKFQNVGQVISNLHLQTAIFDPGLYYIAANGVQFASGSTARTSTATGDGSQGVMFYMSTAASVAITASSGSQSACTSASATGPASSPNGCVVTYSVNGVTSSTGTGTVPSRAAQCPGGPANPTQVPASVDGNILLGPCSGTYGGGNGINRGFLFFQNRATAAQGATCGGGAAKCAVLGGGAGFIFSGFMYFHNGNGATCGTNTSCLSLQGGSGANSFTLGDITVDEVALGGSSAIKMILNPSVNFPLLKPQLLL